MIRKLKSINLIIGLLVIILIQSCGINSSMMLKTDKDYTFDSIPDKNNDSYKLSANDIIQVRLYSNNASKLIDINQGNSTINMNNSTIDYLIDENGFVKLPILGETDITGLTAKEASELLEEKYSGYYVDPFIIITVTNKRVLVFPGKSGDAMVVNILNTNTTLMEAIALAGGISEDGKAKKVKLIRTVDDERKVYLIDLSKIEGLKQADLVVQANDIIYIEPRKQIARGIVKEITPLVTILSTVLLVFTTIRVL
jgi:polysaccharide biosynthesis/export protein